MKTGRRSVLTALGTLLVLPFGMRLSGCSSGGSDAGGGGGSTPPQNNSGVQNPPPTPNPPTNGQGPLLDPGRDSTILVVADSLSVPLTHGNLIPKFIARLASANPTLSFSYRAWSDTLGLYLAPVRVSTGTGSHSVLFHVFATGGSQPQRLFGRDRAVALDPIDPDIILWNHGKNVTSQQSPDGRMLSAFEMARLAKPNAIQIAIIQPPNRDDDKMAAMAEIIPRLCASYGDMSWIDCYRSWIAAGKPASYYDDNLHSGTAGVDALFLPDLVQGWNAITRPASARSAFLATKGRNLLANGDFSVWSGAMPDRWGATGAGLMLSRDTGFRAQSDRPYSLRIEQSGVGGAIRQTFTAPDLLAAIAGQYVWVAALSYIPVGASATPGLVQLTVADEIGTLNLSDAHTVDLRPGAEVSGRWAWNILRTQRRLGTSINASASSLKLYRDIAPSSETVWFDRVIMGVGDLIPHDMDYART